jgi:hypothetical protein
MLLRISLATVFLATTACVVDEGDELDDLPLSEVAQEMGACPKWACGDNSPVLDSFDIHELNEVGLLNAEGFRISHFDNNGVPYSFDVANGQAFARRGFVTLSGPGLVGPNKALIVRRGSSTYRLKFENANVTPFLPLGTGSAVTYKVTWTKVGGTDQPTNVCSNPGWAASNDGELMGMAPDQVVFFEGDRISAGFRITDSADTIGSTASQWFNFGCAGHLLSKLHLTHHTFASKTPGYASVRSERQALMKMYAADYCGIGEAFTLQGTDMGWADHKGWLDYFYPPATMDFEARWNENGAICLEKVRLGGTTPEFPFGVDLAIDAKCGSKRPPKCSDVDFTNFAGAHLITGSP